jgi:Nucleotidyltransferase of unknown function (DUF6036)
VGQRLACMDILVILNLAGQVSIKPDIDFWYNPTYENYFRLLKALEELGQNVSVFKNEKALNPIESFFKFERPDITLDFLPTIIGNEKFSNFFKRRESVNLDKVDVYFMGYEDLIVNKMKIGRPKDLNDIEQLKRIKNSGSAD